jgi:hypothetical protein
MACRRTIYLTRTRSLPAQGRGPTFRPSRVPTSRGVQEVLVSEARVSCAFTFRFTGSLLKEASFPGARPARPGARSGSMPALAAATPIRRAANRASDEFLGASAGSSHLMSVSPERSHAGAESFHLKPCLPDESEFMFQTEVKLKRDRSDQAWMPRRLVLTSEAVLISRTHGRDLLDSVRPSPIRFFWRSQGITLRYCRLNTLYYICADTPRINQIDGCCRHSIRE